MEDASLREVDLLAAHARQLRGFAAQELAMIPHVQGSLDRTEAALRRRLSDWRRKQSDAEREVGRLEAELARCQAARRGGCGGIAAALARGRRDLAEARREVARSEDGLRRFTSAVRSFTPALQRYRGMLDRAVPRAAARLHRHHDRALTYLTGIAGGASAGGGASSGGGSGRGGSTSSTSSTGSTASGPSRPTPLGSTGLVVVALADIDLSGSPVQSEADFVKVSAGEMRASWNRVQEVLLPAALRGEDPRRGAETGSAAAADAFFGSTCIKLSPGADGRYEVVNGYHRLFVAHQMGITAVPARLVGGQL